MKGDGYPEPPVKRGRPTVLVRIDGQWRTDAVSEDLEIAGVR